jgi:hypothetical protein
MNAKGLDFSNAYFRNADLSGIDFRSTNLEGASLLDAKLSGAYFPRSFRRGNPPVPGYGHAAALPATSQPPGARPVSPGRADRAGR